MTAIGILGFDGRMGQAIDAAAKAAGVTVAGGIDKGDPSLADLTRQADVLIDFTAPDALPGHLDAAVAAGTPMVIGTTGLSPEDHARIDNAAQSIAIVQTYNTSLG